MIRSLGLRILDPPLHPLQRRLCACRATGPPGHGPTVPPPPGPAPTNIVGTLTPGPTSTLARLGSAVCPSSAFQMHPFACRLPRRRVRHPCNWSQNSPSLVLPSPSVHSRWIGRTRAAAPLASASTSASQCRFGSTLPYWVGVGGGARLRERGHDTSKSSGRSGRQNAATRRNMRREERVTVQGPVKKLPPDGMSHGGGGRVAGEVVFSKVGGGGGFRSMGSIDGTPWSPTHGPRRLPCGTRLGGRTQISGHKACRTVDHPQTPRRSRAGDAPGGG